MSRVLLEAVSQSGHLGRVLNALPLQLGKRRETRQALEMLARVGTGAVRDQRETADLLLMAHEVSLSIQDVGGNAGPDLPSGQVSCGSSRPCFHLYVLKRMDDSRS